MQSNCAWHQRSHAPAAACRGPAAFQTTHGVSGLERQALAATHAPSRRRSTASAHAHYGAQPMQRQHSASSDIDSHGSTSCGGGIRRRTASLRRASSIARGGGSRGGVSFGAPTKPDTAAEAAESFLQWARSAGIDFQKLRIGSFDGVRGMAAREAVRPGDTFVTLPREAALLATPGQRCPFPEWIDAAFWDAKPWSVRLAVMLLHERRRGDESRTSGYVDHLSQAFDSPLHWSAAERRALQYPHLIAEVEQQERQWAQLHADLVACSPGCGVTQEELSWALECVCSRAFSGPYSGSTLKQKGLVAGVLAVLGAGSVALGGASLESVLNAGIAAVLFNIIYDTLLGAKLKWHALCPVIDTMNHSSTSKSEVAFEYFRDRFSAEAGDPVAAGQQAFITYGRQGNDRLLQFYGFVEADNPADTYVIRDLGASIEGILGQELSSLRRAALEAAGLADALEKGTFTRSGPEAATLAATRAALSAVDPQSASDFQQPSVQPVELLVHQVLAKALEAEQQRLQVAAPAAKSMAKGGGSSGGTAGVAAAFRKEKAAVLAAALAAVRQRAEALQSGA